MNIQDGTHEEMITLLQCYNMQNSEVAVGILAQIDSLFTASAERLKNAPPIDADQPPRDPVLHYWWSVAGGLIEHRKERVAVQMIRERLPENRVEPNDKLTKLVFDPSDTVLAEKEFDVVERPSNKGVGKISTPVSFVSEALQGFDAHDRDVGMACFTLREAGNQFATTEQIYRVMTGNLAARLYDKEDERIRLSLEHLIGNTIRIGMEGLRLMGYKAASVELFGSVLPAKFVSGKSVNGSTRTVVEFLGESPLVTVAKVKNNQLLTYRLESMNMGGKTSPDRMALANYARRRIEECRAHPQMRRTITFEDTLKKNGLGDRSKAERKRYRDYLYRCFDTWKKVGIIADYSMVKTGGRSHGYHGISFSF